MKIGLVLDDSLDRNDGVQQYVKTVGAWLERHDHQVHFLAGQSIAPRKNIHSLAKNVAVKFNGNSLTIPLPASARRITELLEREQYDVLHVQMPYSPMLAGKTIMRAQNSTAVVGTFHILPYGIMQDAGNSMLGRLQQRSLKRFDLTCAVSDAAIEFARKKYGLNPSLITNTIDLSLWKNKTMPAAAKKIVFLGRLVPRKGCKELLLALGALPPAERNKYDIIIGGDGPQRLALQKLSDKLSIKARFIGYVPEADKPALLGSAQIAIFPSLGGESFGIVLLEAMAAGAGLVVGGNNPGYSSVLCDTPECLINFQAPNEASHSLLRLFKETATRKQLHLIQQQAIKKYDVNNVGPQILAMYRTAVLHRNKYVR